MLTLTRTSSTPDGVLGVLRLPNGETLQTVEDDWRDNARNVSCIPAGTYELRRTIFYRHGYETFEVVGVPGRSRILVHVANTENDVQGCIGVGTARGRLWVARDEDTGEKGVWKTGVVNSRRAFGLFMDALAAGDTWPLKIVWAAGVDPT